MKKTKVGKGNTLAAPVQSKDSVAREKRYQGEDDLRTLARAEEIRGDKGRMSNVRNAHEEQHETLTRVGRSLGGRDAKKGRGKRSRKGRRGGRR